MGGLGKNILGPYLPSSGGGSSTSGLANEEFTATAGQTVFTIAGNPEGLVMLFEGSNHNKLYTYEQGVTEGTLTMNNPVYLNTKINVYY